MKKLVFNIIKLLVSIVFQYSIFVGALVFGGYAEKYYYDYTILYWFVFILLFLLGEVGIYLLYKVKPLEKKVFRIIYTIIYMAIQVLAVLQFIDVFFFIDVSIL